MQVELEGEVNLGHLVFGDKWFEEYGGKQRGTDDPLTALYRKEGV
jgi:hypothetical protein